MLGDALSGEGLARGARRCPVAYYLIHSMEPSRHRTRRATSPSASGSAAHNFAREARAAGVERIVYLGGLYRAAAPGGPPRASHATSSRAAVEEVLREGVPDTIALRASIVIGARSRSFRFLVRLVERHAGPHAARVAGISHTADRRT